MLTARELMTTPVLTVTARTPIRDFAQLLVTHHISGVPVLSDDGAMIGMVTEADLLSKTGATVGEIMTPKVVSVVEDTPVQEIARLLGHLQIRRVPVMRGKELVGIVSRGDIVRAVARAAQPGAVLGIES